MLVLVCVAAANADFSYTLTRKSSSGMMAGAIEDLTTRHYQKDQKLKTENSLISTIIDLDAQTVTAINHRQKTYTVTPFAEIGKAVKETGSTRRWR